MLLGARLKTLMRGYVVFVFFLFSIIFPPKRNTDRDLREGCESKLWIESKNIIGLCDVY
jgi:hypothetical protein